MAEPLFKYEGKIYVSPIGRGVVLSNLKDEPQFEDLFEDGYYYAEIRVFPVSASPIRALKEDQ